MNLINKEGKMSNKRFRLAVVSLLAIISFSFFTLPLEARYDDTVRPDRASTPTMPAYRARGLTPTESYNAAKTTIGQTPTDNQGPDSKEEPVQRVFCVWTEGSGKQTLIGHVKDKLVKELSIRSSDINEAKIEGLLKGERVSFLDNSGQTLVLQIGEYERHGGLMLLVDKKAKGGWDNVKVTNTLTVENRTFEAGSTLSLGDLVEDGEGVKIGLGQGEPVKHFASLQEAKDWLNSHFKLADSSFKLGTLVCVVQNANNKNPSILELSNQISTSYGELDRINCDLYFHIDVMEKGEEPVSSSMVLSQPKEPETTLAEAPSKEPGTTQTEAPILARFSGVDTKEEIAPISNWLDQNRETINAGNAAIEVNGHIVGHQMLRFWTPELDGLPIGDQIGNSQEFEYYTAEVYTDANGNWAHRTIGRSSFTTANGTHRLGGSQEFRVMVLDALKKLQQLDPEILKYAGDIKEVTGMGNAGLSAGPLQQLLGIDTVEINPDYMYGDGDWLDTIAHEFAHLAGCNEKEAFEYAARISERAGYTLQANWDRKEGFQAEGLIYRVRDPLMGLLGTCPLLDKNK